MDLTGQCELDSANVGNVADILTFIITFQQTLSLTVSFITLIMCPANTTHNVRETIFNHVNTLFLTESI